MIKLTEILDEYVVKKPVTYKYKVGETVREAASDEEMCKVLDRRPSWAAVKANPVKNSYMWVPMQFDRAYSEDDNNPWYLVEWLESNKGTKPNWFREDELQPYSLNESIITNTNTEKKTISVDGYDNVSYKFMPNTKFVELRIDNSPQYRLQHEDSLGYAPNDSLMSKSFLESTLNRIVKHLRERNIRAIVIDDTILMANVNKINENIDEYKVNTPDRGYKIADWVYKYFTEDPYDVDWDKAEHDLGHESDEVNAISILYFNMNIFERNTVTKEDIERWRNAPHSNLKDNTVDEILEYLLGMVLIKKNQPLNEYKINQPSGPFNKNKIFQYIKDNLTYPPDWDFDDEDYWDEHADEFPSFGGIDNLYDVGPLEYSLSNFIEGLKTDIPDPDSLSPMDTLGLWLYIFRDYNPNNEHYAIKEQVMDEFPNITEDQFKTMLSQVKKWESPDSLTEYKINKPSESIPTAFINQVKDAINRHIVKLAKEYEGEPSVEFVKDEKYGTHDAIIDFIKEHMVVNHYEFEKDGKEIIASPLNVSTISDEDVLDYLESNPDLKRYLNKVIWKVYFETIDIDKIRNKVFKYIDTEDNELKYYDNTDDYFDVYVPLVIDRQIDYYIDPIEIFDENDFVQSVNNTLLKSTFINEYKINKPNSANYRISWYEGTDQHNQEKVETTLANAEKLAINKLKDQYLYRRGYEYWASIELNLGDDIIPRYKEIERINLDPEVDGLYVEVRAYDENEYRFVTVKTIKI